MNLTHGCIITDDFEGMIAFYSEVLEVEPNRFESYAEFPGQGATLALLARPMMDQIVSGAAEARANRSLELEFEVKAVDEECERLRGLRVDEVSAPADYPWGNRAFYFRDPDGNLISFYTRLRAGA